MFKELKLTEDLTILTDTITDVDNEQLVKDIEYICEISKTTNIESKGIQSEIHITSHNIRKLKEIINDKIIAFFNLNNDFIYHYYDWVFVSTNKTYNPNYHNHIGEGSTKYVKEIPQWTLLYYVQMPDNLMNDDGVLYFKTKTNKELSILPKENQFILFKSDVLHKPQVNKNSTKTITQILSS